MNWIEIDKKLIDIIVRNTDSVDDCISEAAKLFNWKHSQSTIAVKPLYERYCRHQQNLCYNKTKHKEKSSGTSKKNTAKQKSTTKSSTRKTRSVAKTDGSGSSQTANKQAGKKNRAKRTTGSQRSSRASTTK